MRFGEAIFYFGQTKESIEMFHWNFEIMSQDKYSLQLLAERKYIMKSKEACYSDLGGHDAAYTVVIDPARSFALSPARRAFSFIFSVVSVNRPAAGDWRGSSGEAFGG